MSAVLVTLVAHVALAMLVVLVMSVVLLALVVLVMLLVFAALVVLQARLASQCAATKKSCLPHTVLDALCAST